MKLIVQEFTDLSNKVNFVQSGLQLRSLGIFLRWKGPDGDIKVPQNPGFIRITFFPSSSNKNS